MDQAACFEWQKSALLDPNSTGYAVACARYLQKDETGKVVETQIVTGIYPESKRLRAHRCLPETREYRRVPGLMKRLGITFRI